VKNLFILSITICLLHGCSSVESNHTKVNEENPYAYFDSIQQKTNTLIDNITARKIVIDSTNIQGLSNDSSQYGLIKMNARFNSKNEIIKSIHYDFYYDSLDQNLERDVDSLMSYFTTRFSETAKVYHSQSMTTYTWPIIGQSVLDFELFNNGYSVTIRRQKKEEIHKEKETKKSVSINPEHIEKSFALVDLIVQKKIVLGSTNVKEINSIFSNDLQLKGYTVSFSKQYGDDLLLSVTFSEQNDLVTAIYFDYMYSNPNKE